MKRKRYLGALAGILWVWAHIIPFCLAEPQETTESSPPPQAATGVAGTDNLDDAVPRGTMAAYLHACREGDYVEAARYLDLSNYSDEERAATGPVLARHLMIVVNRTLWVDLPGLSSLPEGDLDDGLPSELESVGLISTSKGPVDILLERLEGEGEARVWRFSRSTVDRIPALYDELGHGVLGKFLPESFFDIRFMEVELWQWIGFVLLILLAYGIARIVIWIIHHALRRFIARTETHIDDRLLDTSVRPVRYGLALALFSITAYFLNLPVSAMQVLNRVEKLLAIFVVTWLVLRLAEVVSRIVAEHLEDTKQKTALALLPMGRKTVNGAVLVLALIAVFQNLGFNVTGLVAGLGVGGIAVALAAQKSIENLFGGLTLTLDQPVRVGDFCKFGTQMGTVEDVGLRSTRVRTPDRTLISIPNSEFSQTQIENFGARDRIRIYNILGFRYETSPDQLRYLLTELRKLLFAHPKIETDTARVRFVGFGAYSLDVEVFAYALTSDFKTFLAIREDLFLRVMDVVKTSGTGFAFPSQTSYLCRDPGLAEDATRFAEGEIESWRAEGRLPFPHLPAETIQEIEGTLDYPPKGSPEKAKEISGEEATSG